MLIPSQDEWGPSMGTLHVRYRRVLSFGDVLDESIRLFRQHWVNFALVSAVALIPPGLFEIWLTASGPFTNLLTFAGTPSGRFVQAAALDPEMGALVASFVIWALFNCIWSAAVTATTEAYLRGGEPSLLRVYRRALRRLFAVLLGTLLYALGLSILGAIGFVLFVFTVFPGFGGIVPAIALLVWWLNPAARKAWLKWLIIVCTPFGLLIYFGTRWSMYIAAIVLERLGPLASLRRSSELINRQVFRVLAIMTVSSTIVGVLVYTPSTLIAIPLMISSGIVDYGSAPGAVISQAVAVVLRILFQSVGAIVYTVMFVDLRNRHEGTDLAERLTQLEMAPAVPGG